MSVEGPQTKALRASSISVVLHCMPSLCPVLLLRADIRSSGSACLLSLTRSVAWVLLVLHRYAASAWRAEVLSQAPSATLVSSSSSSSEQQQQQQQQQQQAARGQRMAPYAASICAQFAAVLRVQWLYKIRDSSGVRTRLFSYLFFGILVGTMYACAHIVERAFSSSAGVGGGRWQHRGVPRPESRPSKSWVCVCCCCVRWWRFFAIEKCACLV
jgi:hypothetical protein